MQNIISTLIKVQLFDRFVGIGSLCHKDPSNFFVIIKVPKRGSIIWQRRYIINPMSGARKLQSEYNK